MINPKNFIRVEYFKNGKKGKYRKYVYKCNTCDNEIKARKCEIPKRSGKCISCCGKSTIKYAIENNKLRPYESKYNLFKKRCPETDLSYEDYLQFVGKSCTYCDYKLNWQEHGENNPGFWLDRMDSNLGHVKGNLTVCCGLCNHTKRSVFTYEEFLEIGKAIKSIRHKRELPTNGTGC